jgi:acetate kinase
VSRSAVLTLNAGSSSVKAARFDGNREVARAGVALNGRPPTAALDELFQRLDVPGCGSPDAIGHRVVHGGPDFTAPVVVDDEVVDALRAVAPLAPLHQEPGLTVLDAARARLPHAAHIACFDTAFFRGLPPVAQRFAIAERWFDLGVRRYGFHGLSYEYLLSAVPGASTGRVILAHLGSGASMVALRDGTVVDTTMGLTPTGGLVMATRSGDLDPGVLLFMLRATVDPDALEREVDTQSGLLGISQTTADMRRLLDARHHDPRAALAVDVFCASARKNIGALAATLGGLDLLVFSGGIGSESAEIRAAIAAGIEHLNARTTAMRTDEERTIQRHVAATDW